jgi:phospholipid/cholesterol/gamma-HCH transport system permease protein
MTAPTRYYPPLVAPLVRGAKAIVNGPLDFFEQMGHVLTFFGLVLGAIPHTFRSYGRQIRGTLIDLTWGNGRIIVGGGTLSVLAVLGLSIGGVIGLEAYNALSIVNIAPFTGFISAYGMTREFGPLAAALGFAAQAGCRITAEVGAMRIAEEIDALEATGIRSIPFVVTTRVIAGVAVILPVYLLTLILGYKACSLVVNVLHGQSSGTYDYYFSRFLVPHDVVLSLIKTAIFIVVVVIIHGYQGYYASGGPEGVGLASGRAIRSSIVIVTILNMLLTLLFWGRDPGVRISG